MYQFILVFFTCQICTFYFSETRLLEIVEAACEKTDFECNRLLEQIEDQVETWWFHRYIKMTNVNLTVCMSS